MRPLPVTKGISMTEFFSNTAVRIALGAVATTAVAAGSYLIGKQHGAQEAMAQMPAIVEQLVEEAKNALTAATN